MALCSAGMLAHAATVLPVQQVSTAALNRSAPVQAGLATFYAMDYDQALVEFERVRAAHAGVPLATDYVLYVVVFRELNRLDLLDTTFYANDGFLTGKHVVSENPAVRDQIRTLAQQASDEADAVLAKDAKNVDALYARGWAHALLAAYTGLAQRAFPSALKLAISAKGDEEQVLKLDPQYADANLVVGNYEYVVGALPFTFRLLIGIAGISGSKDKGMQMLKIAASDGVLTSVDARTCMMLFLRREARYVEAEAVAQALATQYPGTTCSSWSLPTCTRMLATRPRPLPTTSVCWRRRGSRSTFTGCTWSFATSGWATRCGGSACTGRQRRRTGVRRLRPRRVRSCGSDAWWLQANRTT
ncbi:hypothetical protein [Acidipila sp. EB88]|uniref:hypothetical protein n=1 Tax=Acidipila sp. EB88 TaxID=2305226 RepID=UPI000F5FA2DE|nr:hypothetical protein [Acidipila sp. EB88]RRA49512.1 hypothetical protein D1Y84_15770 [Acidipila sp. EB88]